MEVETKEITKYEFGRDGLLHCEIPSHSHLEIDFTALLDAANKDNKHLVLSASILKGDYSLKNLSRFILSNGRIYILFVGKDGNTLCIDALNLNRYKNNGRNIKLQMLDPSKPCIDIKTGQLYSEDQHVKVYISEVYDQEGWEDSQTKILVDNANNGTRLIKATKGCVVIAVLGTAIACAGVLNCNSDNNIAPSIETEQVEK